MKVLGIIPARGGSKGIPRKNLAPLAGRPLLAYTADAALTARRLSRVVLSTEDEEIATVGRSLGLEAPVPRPVELAQDDTPSLGVVQHMVLALEAQGARFDAICVLQPTTPLRRAEDIDACVELLISSSADTVLSVLPVPPKYNPHWVYLGDDAGLLRLATGGADPIPRRQELPPAYHREGSIYICRRDVLIERNTFYGPRVIGYAMRPEQTVNIDDPSDLERARTMLEQWPMVPPAAASSIEARGG